MISAADFLKGNSTSTGGSADSTDTPQKVQNKRFVSAADFAKNLPAPVAKPTLGQKIGTAAKAAGNFGLDILKNDVIKPVASVATNAINAEQTVRGVPVTTPFSGKFLGDVNPIGVSGDSSTLKGFAQNLKESLGTGLQIGTTFAGGEGATGIVGDTFKGVLKRAAINAAKEGAVIGGGGALGNSLVNNQTLGQTALNTAVGAAGGAVLGAGLSTLGKGLSRAFGKGIPKVVEDTALKSDNSIFDYAKKNGGITVDKEGKMPTSGYVVSPDKSTETRVPINDFSAKDIADFKAKNADALAQDGAHLGIWEDNGSKVLDVSHVTPDLNKAVEIAQKGSQDAIWDLSKNEAIPTPAVPKPVKPSIYTPYTPPEQLPTIDFGKPAVQTPSNLPTIQFGGASPAEARLPRGMRYEPIPQSAGLPRPNPVIPEPAGLPTPPIPSVNAKVNLTKSIAGDAVASRALELNKKLVNSAIDALPEDQLAHFTSVVRERQVNDISDLLSKDLEAAKNMARTGKGIPKEIDPQILFDTVANHAQATGDINLINDLSRSPLASQRSLLAQKLGAAAVAKDSTNPVHIIADLNATFAKQAEKRLGTTAEKATAEVVSKANEIVDKATPKITGSKLQDFINLIPDC